MCVRACERVNRVQNVLIFKNRWNWRRKLFIVFYGVGEYVVHENKILEGKKRKKKEKWNVARFKSINLYNISVKFLSESTFLFYPIDTLFSIILGKEYITMLQRTRSILRKSWCTVMLQVCVINQNMCLLAFWIRQLENNERPYVEFHKCIFHHSGEKKIFVRYRVLKFNVNGIKISRSKWCLSVRR